MSKKKKPAHKAMQTVIPACPLFPYLSLPFGPLFAVNTEQLEEARAIRQRIFKTIFEEATGELKPGDKSSDIYFAYLRTFTYLRVQFFAEDWQKLEAAGDFFDVAAMLMPEMMPLIPMMPETERECYEQEKIAVQHMLHDPLFAEHVRMVN